MTATGAASRIPRVRWGIGVLLGTGVLINYFDRINLSVGGTQLQQQFGLTASELGWLFSGLFWPYALMQIPTGMILDRFGVALVNRLSTFLWSVASIATAFAGGFRGIGSTRSAGRRRSAELPGKLESHWLLVATSSGQRGPSPARSWLLASCWSSASLPTSSFWAGWSRSPTRQWR